MASPLLIGYRGLSALALPFVARRRIDRLRKADVSVNRAHEILGHASVQRSIGSLIWFHAASVGEAKSCLPLLSEFHGQRPDIRFLITTVTPTAADALAKLAPIQTDHQFAPLDAGGPVKRFLEHWRPDLGIFVESEIWPNTIRKAAQHDVPLALVNARLSQRSANRWQKARNTAREIFGRFSIIHCQDQDTTDTLYQIGLRHARRGVNLKSIIRPAQIDELELARLVKAFADRPIWSAVSTHPGEDEIMLDAHQRLLAEHPNAALILVPRHPERAGDIRAMAKGWNLAQRSRNEQPDTGTSIYLADTIGETDLWFRLAPICCLCGSFGDAGGHTPFEPAAAGASLLHGPRYANHSEAYSSFLAAHASIEVDNAATLATTLDHLICNPGKANALARAAEPLASSGHEALTRLANECLALVNSPDIDDG